MFVRTLLARRLVAFAAFAAGIALTTWWIGAGLGNTDRVARVADTVVESPATEALVRTALTAAVDRSVAAAGAEAVVGDAEVAAIVDRLLDEREVVEQVGAALVSAHRAVVSGASSSLSLDGDVVRVRAVEAARSLGVPPDALDALAAQTWSTEIDPGSLPDASGFFRLLNAAWKIAAGVALVLIAAALVVTASPPTTLGHVGRAALRLGLVNGALVGVIGWLVLPSISSSWAELGAAVVQTMMWHYLVICLALVGGGAALWVAGASGSAAFALRGPAPGDGTPATGAAGYDRTAARERAMTTWSVTSRARGRTRSVTGPDGRVDAPSPPPRTPRPVPPTVDDEGRFDRHG